jgi:hypothetical protein
MKPCICTQPYSSSFPLLQFFKSHNLPQFRSSSKDDVSSHYLVWILRPVQKDLKGRREHNKFYEGGFSFCLLFRLLFAFFFFLLSFLQTTQTTQRTKNLLQFQFSIANYPSFHLTFPLTILFFCSFPKKIFLSFKKEAFPFFFFFLTFFFWPSTRSPGVLEFLSFSCFFFFFPPLLFDQSSIIHH